MIGAGVPEHRTLFWAPACFEDDYINRYNYSRGSAAPRDWEGFRLLVRKQFNAVSENEPRARLAEEKQTSTVQEYLERFNKAVARCIGMSEEERTKAFIRGLRAEWRMAIAGWEPSRMVEAINKAAAIEEVWNKANGGYSRPSRQSEDRRSHYKERQRRFPSSSESPDTERKVPTRAEIGTGSRTRTARNGRNGKREEDTKLLDQERKNRRGASDASSASSHWRT